MAIGSPAGYPFNATKTYNSYDPKAWYNVLGFDIWSFFSTIAQIVVDLVFDFFSVIINLLALMALAALMVGILLFEILPAILNSLNFGIVGSFLVIANVLIFGFIGIVTITYFLKIIGVVFGGGGHE